MEGNYHAGFYCTERDQQERHQPSQQQQQQQQQHVAHYPFDLPIPYHTTSQHQSVYVGEQPTRVFPGPHPGPVVPVVPMLSSLYHDTSSGLSDTSIVHQAHQQPPVTLRGHGVKSSTLSADYAPHIITHEPAIELNNLPVITQDPVVERNNLPTTTHKAAVESIVPSTTAQGLAIERDISATTTHGLAVDSNISATTTRRLPVESNISAATTCEPVAGRNNLPTTTCEPVTEIIIQPSTTHKLGTKSITPHPQGQTSVEPAPSKQMQSTDHIEQCQPSSHQASTSPPAPHDSEEEPPLLAALNLKKTRSVADLPWSLSLRVASQDKIEGVVAKERIKKGVEFGPYDGTLMDEEQGWSKDTTWEICVAGRVYHYIDGSKTWMCHLRCAQSEEEQNMEAFQYYGEIYYRSTKVIEPGSELKVFYSKEYQKHVGIQTRLNEVRFNQDAQKFQCSLCEGLYTTAKLILRHIRCAHANSKPNDSLCVRTQKKRMKKPIRLRVSSKHLFKTKREASNQEESIFKCGTCEKVFTSCGRLKAHEIFHEYNQDHTCPVCGKRQKNAQTWAKHMMLHKPVHEPRPHKCNECNGRYKSKAALRKHSHQIHGYPCRLCSERFSRMKDCKKHEQTHQTFIPSRSALEYFVAEPSPDEPKDMLGRSANYYQRPFKCRYCPRRYSEPKTVKTHEKEKHTGEGTFKCRLCSNIFTCESRLKSHLLIHEQTRIYRCTLCPKGFASESALSSHQGEHTGLKPAKCDVCGKGFGNRKLALAHRRRVHQDRPKRFFCSFCNYGFAEKGDLKRHEERHKGIRRYICRECGKRFTSNTSLTAHVRALHTKERPFCCEICGQTFALNFKYTLHMVRHNVQRGGTTLQQ